MKLFSINRAIVADLKEFTLLDGLNKLMSEIPLANQQSFPVKVVAENHLIFEVPRDKLAPRQIHEFKYFEDEKRITIYSKYANLFFPSFFMYGMPLVPMLLGWKELEVEQIKVFALLIIGITLFIILGAIFSIREDSKSIETALSIRLNYLLRQKGYSIPL
ncbi:MAG: hypothetical protein KDD15_10995 [Lewinella sp.]|nr:hypothetical protein [Lewinella sp.]